MKLIKMHNWFLFLLGASVQIFMLSSCRMLKFKEDFADGILNIFFSKYQKLNILGSVFDLWTAHKPYSTYVSIF
mgnify:CR=1 FL=1